MAGTQPYSFAPPPPPPSNNPPPYNPNNPSYGYQPPHFQQSRGGGPPRGGGRGGRGDFNGAPHTNGYNGPSQPGPPNVQYGQQNPPPYIGPQAGPQGPPNTQGGYPPQPQWQQHGPQQHGPPQQGHQPHPAAPLPAQNYHPNYAPQAYNQPTQQYGGPQQPPQFQQPPNYGQPQPHQGGPPHGWQGPPQQQPPQFNAGRGGPHRGRGGFNGSRGGHEAPLMGPPIRMGFDNDRGNHLAQASNGFPQPYVSHQQSPPVPPFSQPFQGYPQPTFSHGGAQRPPLDPNPFHSNPNRGRGNANFRGRGRGDFQQFRGRDNQNYRQFSNGSSPSTPQVHQKPAGADNAKKNKKKRRTNTLGLTPNGVDHEESEEEDDVDEEARLVTLLGPDTPQLPTDLEAWLAERRARFPTKARKEAAEEELRKRRELQAAKIKKENEEKAAKKEGETKLERQQRKAEKLRLELEKAERKIHDAMAGGKRKRENGDIGDEDNGQVSEDSESDSSDSEPEARSSRKSGSNHVSQLPKAQLQRHCKYFSTGGTCGKKGKCRFVHDQEVRNQALKDKEANGGKMTLAQRLILNDTAKDDLTILKSIKYLKEKGLMSDQVTASAPKNDDSMQFKEESGDFNSEADYADV